MIDSTAVRRHSQEAGAKGGFWSNTLWPYDKSPRPYRQSGTPLGFILSGGEASEDNAVEDLMSIPVEKPRLLLADQAYDGNNIRDALLSVA
jgi:hypothetical protein